VEEATRILVRPSDVALGIDPESLRRHCTREINGREDAIMQPEAMFSVWAGVKADDIALRVDPVGRGESRPWVVDRGISVAAKHEAVDATRILIGADDITLMVNA
jgi:hypothetical protein